MSLSINERSFHSAAMTSSGLCRTDGRSQCDGNLEMSPDGTASWVTLRVFSHGVMNRDSDCKPSMYLRRVYIDLNKGGFYNGKDMKVVLLDVRFGV